MKQFVITGVSRGIGFELLRLTLERGHAACGIARSIESNADLRELKLLFGEKLILLSGDVNDVHLPGKISSALSSWSAVDVLINNAGIYRKDKWEDFEETFRTNSIAPYFLTLGLAPLLKKSSSPKAVFISSQMGSIQENSSGGSVSYRASKSALNMMVKCLSLDQSWLTSLILHPGWVRTNMGGENAPLLPKDSAAGIFRVIEESSKSDSGTFRTYSGNTLHW